MGLRVISGSAGGLLLQSPKRHALRPTQDRIRQVIFSSLAAQVPDARVLDLYAGTGSLGIEALSRGAHSALFIEQEREAADCIRANLRHCRLEGGEVRLAPVADFLRGAEGPFDLVFADPPYEKSRGPLDDDPLLPAVTRLLAPGGLFVWEHYAGRVLQNLPDGEIIRHRTYGETGLTFLRYSGKNKKIYP